MSKRKRTTPPVTYVLGDIGGQVDIFEQALRSIGINTETLIVPHYITLIQVGDVIRLHDSPKLDSAKALDIADRLKKNNPDNYIQLWGNHEYGALQWRVPGSGWKIDNVLRNKLTNGMRGWFDAGDTTVAVAVGETLITHAGLTNGYWKQIGSPSSAQEAAEILNADSPNVLGQRNMAPHGYLLNRYTEEMDTNYLWAESAMETYPSWLLSEDEMPFDQVHGHDTPYDHNYSVLKPHTKRVVAENLRVDKPNRRTILQVGDRTITCVDWTLTDRVHECSWDLLSLDPAGVPADLLSV